MRIAVELMREKHLEQVWEIERASFPTPWSRESFAEELENKFAYYIVGITDNDLVAGYGGMWLILDEAQINTLAVRPGLRGNDVGKMLMISLIGRASLSGCLNMTLEVRPANLTARHLYESLGFVEIGLRKGYYEDNGEDAIIMRREGCI